MDFMPFWKTMNEVAKAEGLRELNFREASDLFADWRSNLTQVDCLDDNAIAILVGMFQGWIQAEAYAAH